jgi:hypothetical protein
MENNEQNLDGELDKLVPIVPATNDVYTQGFCSLMDPTFRSTASASHESNPEDETG